MDIKKESLIKWLRENSESFSIYGENVSFIVKFPDLIKLEIDKII